MKYVAFAVFDSKALAFGIPMFVAAKGVAVRAFVDTVRRPDTPMCNHPTDFQMFCIGSYDDGDGVFVACAHELVMTGLDAKRFLEQESMSLKPRNLELEV